MSSFVGRAGNDDIQGSESGDVLVGGAGHDTYVVNHVRDLVIELADEETEASPALWAATSAGEPITLVRVAPHEFCVRIQIEGAPDGVFAEFRLETVGLGALGITGLRIDDGEGPMPEIVMADGDSVWEYAFQLGRPSTDGSPTEFEWYGGGHGFEQVQSLGIVLDGVDFSLLPIGTPVHGVNLSVVQDLQILLPSDGVTVAGSVVLQHLFDSTGLTVKHAHDYLDGFEIGRAYSAMLPVTGAGDDDDERGIDYMQVGTGPAHQIRYDGTTYLESGRPSYATAWGDDHNFLLTMSLPHGGPDVNGDWSRAEEWGMWLYDTALDYSKIYVNWIEGGRGAPAVDSAHETHYSITLRDAGLASDGGAPSAAPPATSQGVDTILSSISLTLPANVEILRLTGTDDLSGFGNELNNTIVGNAGNNLLDGGAGEDLLFGGAGDDTYLIRSTKDHAEERTDEGVDTILTLLNTQTLAKNFENLIFIGQGRFVGTGNGADNQVEGADGSDELRGMGGDDRLIGGAGDDILLGGAGDDHLIGGSGSNTLLGDEGNDRLDGRGGRGTLQGGIGDDVYMIDDRTTSIVEYANEGIDEIQTTLAAYTLAANVEILTFTGVGGFTGVGNGLDNRITGGSAGDLLNGGLGDDVLVGLAGADLLIGGAGSNVLDGGEGVDTAYYAGEPTGVTVNLFTGRATNAYGGVDVLMGIENVMGTALADRLTGDAAANVLNGGDGDDHLSGGGGADALVGGAGVDVASYADAVGGVDVRLHLGVARNDGTGAADTLSGVENVIGSAFNDLITGDAGANILWGGAGADTLIGFAGDDILWGGGGALNTLQGGLGDDLYVVEAADTIVELAGEGVDTVHAYINTLTLAANVENLVFIGTGNFSATGNALNNVITGGAGDDNLRGGGGVDVLNGGAGVDTVDYTLAASGVTARLDRMQATNDGDGATDTFSGIENLIGSNFNDLLIGDNNANVLMGGVGVDVLLGFGGDDILWGGAAGGNNQLQGGLGNDYYVLESFDTVVEFEGEGIDTVEARISSYVLRANVENLIFTGTTQFTGTGNTLDNLIVGGGKDDILRGGGGNDTILGGAGNDELVLRGAASEYAVLQEGAGWRIIDSVSARDGSTYVESIELLRFTLGNATRSLPPPPAALVGDKGLDGPTTLPPLASIDETGPTKALLPGLQIHVGGWAAEIDLLGHTPHFDDWMF